MLGLSFLTMGLYVLLGPLVLSKFIAIPTWSYQVVGTLLGGLVLMGLISNVMQKISKIKVTRKLSFKRQKAKKYVQAIIEAVDEFISLIFLIFHAFGGEGSIAAQGVKSSGLGGRSMV